MIIGILITAFTIVMSIYAFQYYNYKVRDNLHSKLGYAVLIMSGILLISGFIVYFSKIFLKWRTLALRQLKLYHKTIGYAVIIMSQISILLGVKAYNKRNEVDDYNLGIGHIVLFFGIWMILEAMFRVCRSR